MYENQFLLPSLFFGTAFVCISIKLSEIHSSRFAIWMFCLFHKWTVSNLFASRKHQRTLRDKSWLYCFEIGFQCALNASFSCLHALVFLKHFYFSGVISHLGRNINFPRECHLVWSIWENCLDINCWFCHRSSPRIMAENCRKLLQKLPSASMARTSLTIL